VTNVSVMSSSTTAPALTTAAQTLQSTLDSSDLKILRTVTQFNNPQLFKFLDGDNDDGDDEDYDEEDSRLENAIGTLPELRDPAIVAADVVANLVWTSSS